MRCHEVASLSQLPASLPARYRTSRDATSPLPASSPGPRNFPGAERDGSPALRGDAIRPEAAFRRPAAFLPLREAEAVPLCPLPSRRRLPPALWAAPPAGAARLERPRESVPGRAWGSRVLAQVGTRRLPGRSSGAGGGCFPATLISSHAAGWVLLSDGRLGGTRRLRHGIPGASGVAAPRGVRCRGVAPYCAALCPAARAGRQHGHGGREGGVTPEAGSREGRGPRRRRAAYLTSLFSGGKAPPLSLPSPLRPHLHSRALGAATSAAALLPGTAPRSPPPAPPARLVPSAAAAILGCSRPAPRRAAPRARRPAPGKGTGAAERQGVGACCRSTRCSPRCLGHTVICRSPAGMCPSIILSRSTSPSFVLPLVFGLHPSVRVHHLDNLGNQLWETSCGSVVQHLTRLAGRR